MAGRSEPKEYARATLGSKGRETGDAARYRGIMEQPSAEALFLAYLRRHANNELESVLALFEDDAQVEDPVGLPAHYGIEAIRAFYAGTHARNGTMTIEPVGSFLVGGDELAAHVRAELDKAGSPPPMDVIYTIRISGEGRIASLRAWY